MFVLEIRSFSTDYWLPNAIKVENITLQLRRRKRKIRVFEFWAKNAHFQSEFFSFQATLRASKDIESRSRTMKERFIKCQYNVKIFSISTLYTIQMIVAFSVQTLILE